MQCIGLENGLSNCYHDNDVTSCDLSHVASAVCSNKTIPDILVRLVKSNRANDVEGVLQIYYANQWGRVCTDQRGWSLDEANVICCQIGQGVAMYSHSVAMPTNQRLVWLSDVHCTGNESSLTHCHHSGWGYAKSGCYHGNNTVWLRCTGNGKYKYVILYDIFMITGLAVHRSLYTPAPSNYYNY